MISGMFRGVRGYGSAFGSLETWKKHRRHSKLVFTKPGCQMLERLPKLAAEHVGDLCAALAKEERDTLAALRRKIVDEQV